ncbi:hypothetical protein [Burkholderia vietnamiensis]|uniref:hypothetical protein n=1 Tax=Burkholderia vietnamiensis TaxID=60552 RepID=UPI001CF3DD86|nr:hypothetical protein [Burkholderia vietnamiensis]MCA7983431.1 hypothetical protein [Burkholderia vietnamiensis]
MDKKTKKILELLQRQKQVNARLSSFGFDSKTISQRPALIREKFAIEDELKLYSDEEIQQAINHEKIERLHKKHMVIEEEIEEEPDNFAYYFLIGYITGATHLNHFTRLAIFAIAQGLKNEKKNRL